MPVIQNPFQSSVCPAADKNQIRPLRPLPYPPAMALQRPSGFIEKAVAGPLMNPER
jgi:hypothetical protein